jgi:restriction system protein
MARRSKTSPAGRFIEAAALFPWWVCVGLAVASYFLLHAFAQQPPPPVVGKPGLNQIVLGGLLHGLTSVGQYGLPVLLLGSAVLSAMSRRKRAVLVSDAAQSQSADALDGMSWQDFELLVGEGFRLQGYTVSETGGGGPDGGVDLVLRKDGEKFLVQCKQWRAFKVGVQPVRELYGLMAARGAAGGFVVTSGRFTQEAVGFSNGRNVTLVDGPKLRTLLKQARGVRARAEPTLEPSLTRSAPTEQVHVAAASSSPVPTCPVCSRSMVLRTAKRGPSAGNAFWGCSGYSAGCRGTRPV